MTLRAACALAIAVALGNCPAIAQSDAAIAARGPNYQAAYTLAQELRDEKSVIFETARAFETDSIALVLQNPELAEIEKQFPGAVEHMFHAARPELERYIVDSLPDLWTALATLLSAELTSAEIEMARDYYSSPAGRRFKASMLRNYDISQEIAPLVKDIDAKLDPSVIRRGIQGGVGDTIAEMSAADRAALLRFAGTSAFRKIKALNTRLLQISADWGNAPAPEFEARLEKIMAAALDEFLTQKAQ
jgi:hypothetical protein